MHVVLVTTLPVLVVLVVVVTRIMTVAVAVLVALLVVGSFVFATPGAVSLPAVRSIAIFFFVTVLAIFAALLIGGTVFLVGR